jgi:hypothetical protein
MSMTIPNVDGLAPRAKTEMYSYDHDLAAFVAIGSATVSADGSLITSDPGIGVMKAGWHCGGNPNTTGSAGTCPDCNKCSGSGCVPSGNGTRGCNNNECKICSNGNCLKDITYDTSTCCNGEKLDLSTQCCVPVLGGYGRRDIVAKGATITWLGKSLADCPNRGPHVGPAILQENNGCSASPWNYLAAALGLFESFDRNNPTGEFNTVFGNTDAQDFSTPCGAHDKCYQSCMPTGGKAACDNQLLTDMNAVCNLVPPTQTAQKVINGGVVVTINIQEACYKNAFLFFTAVDLAGGGAYDDGEKNYCDCCGQ